jgi:hypothetical protein
MRHKRKEYQLIKERTIFDSTFFTFHSVKISLTSCSPAEPVYVSLNSTKLIFFKLTQFIE